MKKSEALSKPETIIDNDNIFKKLINQSGNNYDTTCLDLALKNNLSIDKYITNLGKYNLRNFTIITTPEKKTEYKYIDYSDPCPVGWTNENGECINLSNYNGLCDYGQELTGYKNCSYRPIIQRCAGPVEEGSPKVIGIATQFNMAAGSRGVQSYGNWYSSYCGFPNAECSAYYRLRFSNGVVSNMNIYSQGYGFTNPDVSFALENVPSGGVAAILQGSTTTREWFDINVPTQFVRPNQSIVKFSGITGVFNRNPVDYSYECTKYEWRCDPYKYRKGSKLSNYSNDQKKEWAKNCKADWPEKTGEVITPAYDTCNVSSSWIERNNSVIYIGVIPVSQNPLSFVINYIFENNILPNQDAYFAYFTAYNYYYLYLSNTSDANVFTNEGKYDEAQTEKCRSVNSSYINYPVSVFKLNSLIYKDANFSACASINNSINNINRMTSNKQIQEFSQNIKALNERFTNYEQNQYDTSTKTVQKNLNEIIKNLTDNYNQKAQIYNSTANAVKNHDIILSNRNKLLNKQSDDLLKIQDQIILKTREIELNNETTNKQLFIKRVMQGSFVLLPLIIIMLILMYYQAVGPYISLGIISLLVIGYIIYIVIINNKMKIRQFLKPAMGTIQQYENAARQAYADIIPPVCKGEDGEEEGNDGNKQLKTVNLSILNANGPFYYYDGSAPPEQIHPTPVGSIQFDTGDGIVVFPEELNMSLDSFNNIMLYIFFASWIGLMMKNGIDLNDPKFLKKLNITDLEDSPTTYNLPLWENIGLPLTSDFDDNIKVKCSRYDDIRSKSGKNASVFLVDTWNFFIGDRIPNDIYEKWLKKINSAILQNRNLPKVYSEFYQFVISSKQFKEKYPAPNGIQNFIQTKFTDFLNFLSQNVKYAEKPSFDLNFNL